MYGSSGKIEAPAEALGFVRIEDSFRKIISRP